MRMRSIAGGAVVILLAAWPLWRASVSEESPRLTPHHRVSDSRLEARPHHVRELSKSSVTATVPEPAVESDPAAKDAWARLTLRFVDQ
ncbi:MAG: hypothetical protein KDB53_13875, partial [Planctomycetes bacterium]|nr:hypothetical protein [Planctomycetota bacterium]